MGRSNRKKSNAEDKVSRSPQRINRHRPSSQQQDSRDVYVLEQSNWRSAREGKISDPLPRKSSTRNSQTFEPEDIAWKNRSSRRSSVPYGRSKRKSPANARRFSDSSVIRSPPTTLTSDFTKPDWKTAMIIAVQESQTKPVIVPDWVVKAIVR